MNRPSRRAALPLVVGLALAAGAALAPSTASAQVYVSTQPVYYQQPVVYQQPAMVYAHYRRVMWRLGVGGAYGSFGTTINGTDFRVSGGGVNYNAAIGYAVADNFALHVDLNGVTLFSPGVSSSASSTISVASGTSYTTGIVGGGFTYYFMPFNFMLSGSVGLALLQADSTYGGATLGQSRLGFGANVLFGKEWFIGNGLGLGVAGQVLYALIPDQEFAGTTPLWHNVAVGAMVTMSGF